MEKLISGAVVAALAAGCVAAADETATTRLASMSLDARLGGGANAEGPPDAGPDTAVELRNLEYLTVVFPGSDCRPGQGCWLSIGVHAPSELVLDDEAGVVELSITTPEFERIAALARSASFGEMDDALNPCPHPRAGIRMQGGVQFEFQWSGEAPRRERSPAGCLSEDNTIVEDLTTEITTLWHDNLTCPPSTVMPPELDPNPEARRSMCTQCRGQCDGEPSTEPPTSDPTPSDDQPELGGAVPSPQ